MLNYLWASMILLGIVFAACTGRMADITTAALDSSKEAVTLCITMIGVMSFWMGFMKIAERAGILRHLSSKILPLIHFLFPNLPPDHPAIEPITTNIIANILGLGWAATPAGLKAMEALRKYHRDAPSAIASNEMCTFLILNISSLQIIPMNIIAYRNQYGSVNPAAIVGPGILATIVSTTTAIIFCKIMDPKRTDNG